MSYQAPTPYIESGDEILTNAGQEVELHERTVLGDLVDKDGKPTGEQGQIPNPLFAQHRNGNSRVWLKNGKALRILAEVDGVVDKTNPLAVAKSSCKSTECQSVYVRVRIEESSESAPSDPSLEEGPS